MSLSILASPKIFIRLANVIGYNMLMLILVLDLIIALVFGFWFLVFGFNRVLLAGCGQAGIKIFSNLYLVIYIQ